MILRKDLWKYNKSNYQAYPYSDNQRPRQNNNLDNSPPFKRKKEWDSSYGGDSSKYVANDSLK